MRRALFFLASLSIIFCSNGVNAEEQNVKIGFLSPQTGPLADIAEGFEIGGEIAIDDLNDKYDGEYNFELVIADSACDSYQAENAAQELVNENVIGIAGAVCSGATLGAMPVVKDAQIPLISYGSTSPEITNADDDGYLWRIVPSDDRIGLGLANLLYADASYYSPSVIYDEDWTYLESAAEYFEEMWETTGLNVCNVQSINEGQTDFSAEVDNIENDDCDSVVIFSYDDEMVGIIEELHDQYVDIGMFGTEVNPESFIDSFEDSYDPDGVYTMNYTTKWNIHNPAVREHFDAACDGRSDDCDSYFYHHESYDTVQIIAEAFVLSGGDYDDVNSFIEDIGYTYIGATSALFFDSNGDVAGPGHDICEYTSGIFSTYYNCDGIWQSRFGIFYDDTEVYVPLGFLNPLSGPIAVYAEGFTVSWDVAQDHLNEIYGFLDFNVWEEDSACDGETATSAAQTLVDDGVYAIAGAACSGATLGAIEVTSENQIPQVAYVSTNPEITDVDDDGYLFRVEPSDAEPGQVLGDLAAYFDIKNPALLINNDFYYYGESLESRLDEYDIEICTNIAYDSDQTDFSNEVSEIRNYDCDSVIMLSYSEDAAHIIAELRGQEVHVPVFVGEGIANQSFLDYLDDPGDAEGVFTTKPIWNEETLEGDYFQADYYEKCDEEYDGGDCQENAIYLHEAYDSVMILGRAIYASGSSGLGSGGDSGELIRDMLPYVGKSYQGASGLIDFDENGDISGAGYDICRFEYVDEDLQFVCHGVWTLRNGVRGLDGIDVIDNEPPVVWISDVSIEGMDYIEENYNFCEDHDEIGCDNIDEIKIKAIFSQEEYGYVYLSSEYYDELSYLEDYEWYSDRDGFLGNISSSLWFVSDSDGFLSEGTHNITVRGMDNFGVWSNWSESLHLEIVYNVRPVVKQIYITDQAGNAIHESHRHFCCEEIYFEAGEIEDDGDIIAYEWYDSYSEELISTEYSFMTSDYDIGDNYVLLRVKDDLGIWSYTDGSWFFVYPYQPSLEVSAVIGDEYDGGHGVIFEIKAIPDQNSYGYDGQTYRVEMNFNETTYHFELYEETVDMSLFTWFEYGVHDVHFEMCHNRDWYEEGEDHSFCSVTSLEVRINAPPTASIEDIANSDSPVSAVFMEKIFFEGKASDEDGDIVEYKWISSIDNVISTNKTFSKADLSLGNHIITLSVRDNDGKWAESESFELFIYTNPIAHAGDDITVVPGTTVQFAGAGTDEDGEIVKYEWDLNGDGIFEFKSDDTGLTTFIYNSEGSFTVTLRVTDNDGNTATDVMEVNVKVPKAFQDSDEGLLPSLSFIFSVFAIAVIAFRRR